MAINYEDVNGRITFYGPQETTHQFSADVADADGIVYKEVEADWDQLPAFTTADIGNDMFGLIPAHSGVLSCSVHVIEPFDALITLNVGHVSAVDGTTADEDGFAAAVVGDAVGFTEGAGATVGADSGVDPVAITVTPSGAVTQGRVRVVIGYSPATDDAAGVMGTPIASTL